jgi:hypothetical protein
MIVLPPKGGKACFQAADDQAVPFLSWHGFHIERWVNGGECVARRDLDGFGVGLAQEPPPPRFPIHIV